MNTRYEENTQEIIDGLSRFGGTTGYYRHSPLLFPFFYLTDGTQYIAEKCQAYWLFDYIAIHQLNTKISKHPRLQELQFWTIDVSEDLSAVITCAWDENKIIHQEKIDHTDFPLDTQRVFVSPLYSSANDSETPRKCVAYLPSEY